MIIALRTDTAKAEIYVLSKDGSTLAEKIWEAGRKLSLELLPTIDKLMQAADKELSELSGVIVYEGPGSFTGLRIGITTANALAYAQAVSVVGARGEGWLENGAHALESASPGLIVMPLYGGEPNITKPRK